MIAHQKSTPQNHRGFPVASSYGLSAALSHGDRARFYVLFIFRCYISCLYFGVLLTMYCVYVVVYISCLYFYFVFIFRASLVSTRTSDTYICVIIIIIIIIIIWYVYTYICIVTCNNQATTTTTTTTTTNNNNNNNDNQEGGLAFDHQPLPGSCRRAINNSCN